jgi:UDP-N-acetylmuramyl pentapeptide phosphotransferase/UDP-N-acetylglucosamine-1-phosphate transferase
MKIVYRITEEDFMEAHDLFVANEKWTRRMSRRTMPWMGGLILLLSIVVLSFGKDRIVGVPFALMGAYFLYCGFALRRFFRKLYRKDQRYQHEITADISEDGVHVVTPSADTQMKWSAIVRFLESDKIFLFFYAAWSFSVVPKRAFAPGEIESFRDMLHRKTLGPA